MAQPLPRVPKKEWIAVAVIGLAAVAGWFAYQQWRPVSDDERHRYGGSCRDWITEEYGNGRQGWLGEGWRRNGRIVFEILIPQADRPATASVFLCVYDPSTHNMLKPSAWDNSWRR